MLGVSLSRKPLETAHCSCVTAVCLGSCPKPWGQKLSDFNISGNAITLSEYKVCSLAVTGLRNLENEIGKAFSYWYFPGTDTMLLAWCHKQTLQETSICSQLSKLPETSGALSDPQMPWFGSQWQAAEKNCISIMPNFISLCSCLNISCLIMYIFLTISIISQQIFTLTHA